jgi:hypothetical protein
MTNFNDEQIDKIICEILIELAEDPRFSYEDCAASIREKLFKPYQKFLLTAFNVSHDAYERTRV